MNWNLTILLIIHTLLSVVAGEWGKMFLKIRKTKKNTLSLYLEPVTKQALPPQRIPRPLGVTKQELSDVVNELYQAMNGNLLIPTFRQPKQVNGVGKWKPHRRFFTNEGFPENHIHIKAAKDQAIKDYNKLKLDITE